MTAESRKPHRMPATSIAFVGLGAMGAPMAENLVKRQFRVTGFDMRESARTALVAAGDGVTSDPDARQVARSGDASRST